MRDVAIIIPTIDPARAEATGRAAVQAANVCCETLICEDVARWGFTRTVNWGLTQVESDQDALLLNDDVGDFPDGWLRDLAWRLHSAGDIGMVGPAGDITTAETQGWKPSDKGTVEVPHLSFWCVLIRQEVLSELGPLDERYIHYASDFDYCDRARQHGWRLLWDRDVVLTHALAGSGTQVAWRAHDLSLYQYRSKREAHHA